MFTEDLTPFFDTADHAEVARIGAEYLSLPGSAGNSASTPDSVAVGFTGDRDIIFGIAPLTLGTNKGVISKFVNTAGGWRIYLLDTGLLRFQWSEAGNFRLADSTQPWPFGIGVLGYAKISFDVDNGAGGCAISYRTSPDGVAPYTPLGLTVTQAGATIVTNSAEAIHLGNGGTSDVEPSLVEGNFHRFELRNGIDGLVVASFDPGRGLPEATSLVARSGELWTINQSGSPAAALEGGGESVNGIFDEPSRDDVLVGSTRPTFMCATAALPADFKTAMFQIRSRFFKMAGAPDVDETGSITTLELEEQ